MFKKLMMITLVILAFSIMAQSAHCSLTPMSWGFPTLLHNSSLTSFESQFGFSNDFEFTDISFPARIDMAWASFPTITQTSQQVSVFGNVKYFNQQESMQFSYPWFSVGFSPVPSMGFL
ncbi:hypothetical protein Mtc_2060 [Methanocella conradii HZ254]|uniref:Uncharacterized protein n=1 Tax=Methanocella conradii (strain DSM 24694 / JCM 17849 / CGMCC 1.5162 / HZ254) TaxID=1041930 RepID=H8I7D3_METCZ|nr:hypothetical protein [Methanocella conradii]AFD00799.1 hypothetical protein Mtc_2060 [Methanocella conradii HZ254]MDI6897922.1 hypothetical protein [Methanocella conradii]